MTNSELKEDVETLETRIQELEALHANDTDKIKQLCDELETSQVSPWSGLLFVPAVQRSIAKTLARQLNQKPLVRQRTTICTPVNRQRWDLCSVSSANVRMLIFSFHFRSPRKQISNSNKLPKK